MFEGIPTGHDAHLFSNVLHDWDVPRVRHLLEASHRALDPGGLLIVHDVHLNADKTGPIHAAEYSALLMHVTEGRCYSVAEMEHYLAQAGFSGVGFLPTAAGRSVITAIKAA
jgi:acetylserotonin N-methyltransferase